MKRLYVAFATVLIFTFVCGSSAMAERRLALVIGINAYQQVPKLGKAVGDAEAIGTALERVGFKVTKVVNANRRDLNRSISDFQKSLSPGDVALLHFSGHGVEIDGVNYLLPADVPKPDSGDEDYLKEESISLDSVLERLDATGAGVRILIIDACRDNPFATGGTRSIGGERGLARVEAPKGTFIMYSAGYRQTALDRLSNTDRETTSVYTRVLLRELAEPGKDIAEIAKSVRSEVAALAKAVGHDQFPAYYDELTGQVILNSGGSSLNLTTPATSSSTAPVDANSSSINEASDLEYWQSVKDSTDPKLVRTYLDKFPNGVFVDLAKAKARSLEKPQASTDTSSEKTVQKKASTTSKSKAKSSSSDKTATSRKVSPESQGGSSTMPSSRSAKSCREGNRDLCRLNCAAGVARACNKLRQLGG